MAGSVNKAILIGNVGKDPEIRHTQGGDPIASFSIATSETWKDKNSGERKERTQWHNIVVFNKPLCEVVEKYVKKGMKVHVEGQIETRKWQDKDGADRYSTEIVLRQFKGEITLLSQVGEGRSAPDPDGYGKTSTRESGSGYGAAKGGEGPRSYASHLDDSIPF